MHEPRSERDDVGADVEARSNLEVWALRTARTEVFVLAPFLVLASFCSALAAGASSFAGIGFIYGLFLTVVTILLPGAFLRIAPRLGWAAQPLVLFGLWESWPIASEGMRWLFRSLPRRRRILSLVTAQPAPATQLGQHQFRSDHVLWRSPPADRRPLSESGTP